MDQLFNWSFIENSSFIAALGLVFVASLIGSAHCVSMCGPLAAGISANNNAKMISYHFGRLIGYLLVGLGFGFFGKQVLASQLPLLNKISAVTISAVFAYMGIRMLMGSELRLGGNWAIKALGWLPNRVSKSPFTIGLFTPLLPCSWLYGFAVASMLGQGAIKGSLLMLVFWAGTLPLLLAVQLSSNKLLKLGRSKYRYILGVLFIVVGVYTMIAKFSHTHSEGHSEHMHNHETM